MQNIENSWEILSLMLYEILLDCTEMAYDKGINEEISFQDIPVT